MSTLTSTPWLVWGVLPVVSANIGYWVPVLALELYFASNRGIWSQLVPRSKGRAEAATADRANVASLATQMRTAAWILLGPNAIINAALGAVIMHWLCGTPETAVPPTWQLMLHLICMAVIGDFGLYVGHRVQHASPFLWNKFHWFHHQIGTPTPASAIYIDSTDATLQAGLPMIMAAVCVRPHPLTLNLYICLRIAENVINHSGLDSTVVNILTLRFLPGRAEISHHDSHHQYSNYANNAKNFGEGFWIWDWAFGTLSTRQTKRT